MSGEKKSAVIRNANRMGDERLWDDADANGNWSNGAYLATTLRDW